VRHFIVHVRRASHVSAPPLNCGVRRPITVLPTTSVMKKSCPSHRQNAGRRRSPVTGVAWYTESEWSRVRSTTIDPDRFEASFGEWSAMAEKALVDLRKAGIVAEKCLINADELHAWCLAKGIKNDAGARARFVSEQLSSRNRGSGA